MAGTKRTSVTALTFALLLLMLAIAAPVWWCQREQNVPPSDDLAASSADQGTHEIELAPRESVIRPQYPQQYSSLAGPESLDPPAVAIATQSERLPAEVVEDDRPHDLPTVTGPVLEPAVEGPSREMAELDPEEPAMETVPLPLQVWPQPDSLLTQIDCLAELEPEFAKWCEELKRVLTELRKQGELSSDASRGILSELKQLKELGEREAAARQKKPAGARATRITLALARRLAIWNIAARWTPPVTHVAFPIGFEPPAEWSATLQSVRTSLSQDAAGQTWVKYLKLAEIHGLALPHLTEAERRNLARDVLRRMESTQLNDDQLQFLASSPFDKLHQQLALFAVEPLDMVRLLADLEKFEVEPLSINARPISTQYEIARWSADPLERELANLMNAHYRNANVRVAISADFLNRVLPQMTQYDRVTDNIQGAAVQGESHTATRLRIILFPDRWRWRMGLEARGEVNSSTSSTKGPATFYQDGYSQFRARKLLTIDRRNISLFGAEATAASSNTLTDYETEYDGIPIFNSIARSIARQQYDETSGNAKYEVENKIAGRASRTLDQQVGARVNQASTQLQSHLLAPLQALDLDPTAIDMETTESRLIARYRLAGHEQLGSSTPRPQAPGDSWLSAQIHQSAVNNMLAHLNLEGERKELRALYAEISGLFVQKKVPIPADIPENVFATFADHDAVYIDCEKGRVRVTIRLKELAHEKLKWKNFVVRAYYVPDPDQKSANLVRDGVIELIGKNLRFGDQVALRGIFSKVLSKNRNINLINESLAKSKALKDLHVSQFAIQDGWVGIALTPGPQRPILYTKPPVPADELEEELKVSRQLQPPTKPLR